MHGGRQPVNEEEAVVQARCVWDMWGPRSTLGSPAPELPELGGRERQRQFIVEMVLRASMIENGWTLETGGQVDDGAKATLLNSQRSARDHRCCKLAEAEPLRAVPLLRRVDEAPKGTTAPRVELYLVEQVLQRTLQEKEHWLEG